MKISKRTMQLSFTSLLVIGMLFSLVVGALAATPTNFTLLGALKIEAGVWSVTGTVFTITTTAPATICYQVDGITTFDCTTLIGGEFVKVAGKYDADVTPHVYVAESITLQNPATIQEYEGVLGAIAADKWTVNGLFFYIDADGVAPDTTLPEFKAVGDTVRVKFTLSTNPLTLGNYLATEIIVWNSAGVYTYEGILTAFTETTWTVDDRDPPFDVTGLAMPFYFGVGDEVKVTFEIEGGVIKVTKVEVTETLVPEKTVSQRCKTHTSRPNPFGMEDMDDSLFCLGFGWGEVKQAYKLANTEEGITPQMLLALRASGLGWGEIKHMLQEKPVDDGDDGDDDDDGDSEGQEKEKDKDKDKDKGPSDNSNANKEKHTNNGKGPNK